MKLDRAQLALAGAVAGTCVVSIFAAEVLLALGLAVFALRIAGGRTRFPRLPLDGPIVAFAVWTLLSAAFSNDPLWSHESSKKLVLFLLLYLAVDSAAFGPHRERLVDALLLGGVVLSADMLLQYYFLGFDSLNQRPRSFLGHYMTASGLAMAVGLLGAARLVLRHGPPPLPARDDWRALAGLVVALGGLTALQATRLFPVEAERLFVALLALAAGALVVRVGTWPGPATSTTLAALAVLLSGWALLVSRTRSAWLGAVLGALLLALMRAPRAVWLVPAALGGILLVRPAAVVERLTVVDDSSRDRYYMWQAGLDMLLDRPVFGQGPGMIRFTYPHYRWPEAPNPETHHLHNNVVQLAAERGVPGLAWWLWLMVAAVGGAWKEYRRGHRQGGQRRAWAAGAALVVLAAVHTMGLFEYNLGDSEVLMFTLFVSALPYALRRESARA